MQRLSALLLIFTLMSCGGQATKNKEASSISKSEEISEGEKKRTNSTCVCPMIYAPVCGEDGQTYSNSCEAECAGVEVTSGNPCR